MDNNNPAPNNDNNPNGTGDTPPNGANNDGTGTPPVKKGDAGDATPPQNQLTDEQWKTAFAHPRFKELSEANNKLKEIEKQNAEAEQKRLKEQGKFEEAAEKAEQRANDAEARANDFMISSSITAAAAKAGAQDPAIVAKLIDKGDVKIDDKTGQVTGVDEAMATLQESNAYLFKTGATKDIGTATNPSGNQGGSEFTLSQLDDPEFYQKNQPAIDKAIREGRIDMTK